MESTKNQFVNQWGNNSPYFDMLALIASLSKLFSDNTIPYLDYRITENLFCKYYKAINDARSCTAYDARLGSLGIGIKTFGIPRGQSVEKIAEFNKLKPQLDKLKSKQLAIQLAKFRNDRIDAANGAYNVTNAVYHIIGRVDGALNIFNSPYNKIEIDDIHDIKDNATSISFVSKDEFYTFNKSKSVLQKRFSLPETYKQIPIEILEDPLQVLSQLLTTNNDGKEVPNIGEISPLKQQIKGIDYVILPLYSTRKKIIHVPEKSGLNQWNASGRKRNEDEVYIPVPRYIHNNYPGFFPDNNRTKFELDLPNGEKLSAKMCQSGLKGLMSNPNSALGNWILRKVLKKRPHELVTLNDLLRFGIDSVRIDKTHRKNEQGEDIYTITFASTDYESYQDFIEED